MATSRFALLVALSALSGTAQAQNLLYSTETSPPSITVIDADTLATITTLSLAEAPGRPVASTDGKRVFVETASGIVVIDTSTHLVETTLPFTGVPEPDPSPGFVWAVQSSSAGGGPEDGTLFLNRIHVPSQTRNR